MTTDVEDVADVYQLFKALKDGDIKLGDELPVFSNPNFKNTSFMLSWDTEYALRGSCLDDLEVVPLNPEDKKAMFLERLEEYLSESFGGDGGWPEISQDQVNDARDILNDLLGLKFTSDSDGDNPLRVHITNRSIERQVFPMTIPHKGDHRNPLEQGGKLDRLLTGLSGLANQINTTMSIYQLETRNDEEDAEEKKKREAAE